MFVGIQLKWNSNITYIYNAKKKIGVLLKQCISYSPFFFLIIQVSVEQYTSTHGNLQEFDIAPLLY